MKQLSAVRCAAHMLFVSGLYSNTQFGRQQLLILTSFAPALSLYLANQAVFVFLLYCHVRETFVRTFIMH